MKPAVCIAHSGGGPFFGSPLEGLGDRVGDTLGVTAKKRRRRRRDEGGGGGLSEGRLRREFAILLAKIKSNLK